jgi:hypothetical protein
MRQKLVIEICHAAKEIIWHNIQTQFGARSFVVESDETTAEIRNVKIGYFQARQFFVRRSNVCDTFFLVKMRCPFAANWVSEMIAVHRAEL